MADSDSQQTATLRREIGLEVAVLLGPLPPGRGLQADLIYIDASHEEEDVYQDLSNYWKLLRPGGVMMGDDWHANWPGVICAVHRFVKEHSLRLQVSNLAWITKKQ